MGETLRTRFAVHRRSRVFLFLVAVGSVFLSACSRHSQTVEIYCASSLGGLVEACLEDSAERQVRIQLAGSDTLLAQCKAGARPSLLLLADPDLIPELPTELQGKTSLIATNRLVLVSLDGAEKVPPMPVSQALDLLQDDSLRLGLCSPKSAPLGRYSEQALGKVACRAEKIPLKDSNNTLASLLTGHVDLAVLYASDLKRHPELRVLHEFPVETHSPIEYQVVLPSNSNSEVLSLFQKISPPNANAELEKLGFRKP